jgi:hypothetical protein
MIFQQSTGYLVNGIVDVGLTTEIIYWQSQKKMLVSFFLIKKKEWQLSFIFFKDASCFISAAVKDEHQLH